MIEALFFPLSPSPCGGVMAFSVHLNSYVLVILCALLWYGDRQLAAKHAEECQGGMLPIATDRLEFGKQRGEILIIICAKISVLHRANQTVWRTGIVRIRLPAKSQISKSFSARYGVR